MGLETWIELNGARLSASPLLVPGDRVTAGLKATTVFNIPMPLLPAAIGMYDGLGVQLSRATGYTGASGTFTGDFTVPSTVGAYYFYYWVMTPLVVTWEATRTFNVVLFRPEELTLDVGVSPEQGSPGELMLATASVRQGGLGVSGARVNILVTLNALAILQVVKVSDAQGVVRQEFVPLRTGTGVVAVTWELIPPEGMAKVYTVVAPAPPPGDGGSLQKLAVPVGLISLGVAMMLVGGRRGS